MGKARGRKVEARNASSRHESLRKKNPANEFLRRNAIWIVPLVGVLTLAGATVYAEYLNYSVVRNEQGLGQINLNLNEQGEIGYEVVGLVEDEMVAATRSALAIPEIKEVCKQEFPRLVVRPVQSISDISPKSHSPRPDDWVSGTVDFPHVKNGKIGIRVLTHHVENRKRADTFMKNPSRLQNFFQRDPERFSRYDDVNAIGHESLHACTIKVDDMSRDYKQVFAKLKPKFPDGLKEDRMQSVWMEGLFIEILDKEGNRYQWSGFEEGVIDALMNSLEKQLDPELGEVYELDQQMTPDVAPQLIAIFNDHVVRRNILLAKDDENHRALDSVIDALAKANAGILEKAYKARGEDVSDPDVHDRIVNESNTWAWKLAAKAVADLPVETYPHQ